MCALERPDGAADSVVARQGNAVSRGAYGQMNAADQHGATGAHYPSGPLRSSGRHGLLAADQSQLLGGKSGFGEKRLSVGMAGVFR